MVSCVKIRRTTSDAAAAFAAVASIEVTEKRECLCDIIKSKFCFIFFLSL